MIKDYFVDIFLQISIILSLLKSEYRDLSLFNQLNTRRDDFNGEFIVSSINNFHNPNEQNSGIGYVHPKNARIEDVLRSVHSLGHYRSFRGISSDIVNAFLVDETSNVGSCAGGSNGAGSRSSPIGDSGLPHPNSPTGDEPTKEDMDLIDVLWRYDIDLEVTVDPPLMWELEKELEVHLHKKLEEEAIALVQKQENGTSDFNIDPVPTVHECNTGGRERTSQELNIPDVLENSGFSFFNEQVRTQENIESDWTSLMNLFGVRDNMGVDVEGEMFSNLFDVHGNEQVKEEEIPPARSQDFSTLFDSSENVDFQLYNTSMLEGSMGLFEDLGMDLNFDELPDLTFDADNSPDIIRLTGEQTPSSITASVPSFYDLFAKDESAFAPSESKCSTSDRMSSSCSFSSDSLLTSCTTSFSTWANSGDVSHNHTYNTKLSQEPYEEKEDNSKEKVARATRSRDEVKLKQLDIPFLLDEIINNPIEWFTDVITSPKYGLTPQQVDFLRGVRKRGKNKEAAQNCRKRKLDEIQSLELEVEALTSRKNELEKSCGSLENSVDKLTRKFTELQEKILSSVKNRQKFESGNLSLQFDHLGVLRVEEGSQEDKWGSNIPNNPNKNAAKTKRKQQKRN